MQQQRAMVVQQRRTMETRVAPLAHDERSNAARPTHGQRATSRPSSRKGAAQNQRTIGQPPPRNISPKQQPRPHIARGHRATIAPARALMRFRERRRRARSENHGSDTTVGDPDHAPRRGSGRTKIHVSGDDQYDEQFKIYDINRVFKVTTLLALVPGSNRNYKNAGSSRDTASREPTTIVAPGSQFRTCPTDHGKSV
ncbi:ankyrin repeat-containing protein-like [Dorcoceras hygrometricum]|uniref:Ankyrin repeat-containing protein-like n=1 Tax=Dorcoceras hygrometricum TaxID=472368 RepID=A0A2Z7BJC2_9LAMI|nr:ankyrin repeat-containing protein-like [Dorcoceras hygrometricum]